MKYLLYCRGLFVLLVILLWRKFIYHKSASVMWINPELVFTFSAKGGVVQPSVHIQPSFVLKIKYTPYSLSTYFLLSQQ